MRTHIKRLLLACAIGSCGILLLKALPTGSQVPHGNATVSQQNAQNMLINQHTQRAVIDWQSFSIANGEKVQFQQPSIDASVLNRVVGGNVSEIYGQISANGQVLLLNPQGIIVGSSGMIDTHSFIASTLDMSDQAFMQGGDLHFFTEAGHSVSGKITNLGQISANGGDLVLIAKDVENEGSLNSPNGTAGIAAGHDEVLLADSGKRRLLVRLDSGDWGLPEQTSATNTSSTVKNSGQINALRAELISQGGNPLALAIDNEGAVMANDVVNRNGEVWLVATQGSIDNAGELTARNANGSGGRISALAKGSGSEFVNSGSMDVSGTSGGTVVIEAPTIRLHNGTSMNASGSIGDGGKLFIGGDFQGKSLEYADVMIDNADDLFAQSDVTLKADGATQSGSGNGGVVILWSDNTTEFGGFISIRGGVAGGDGGLAEVSGKQVLRYSGITDARAPFGKTGDLYLDPATITVRGGGSGAGAINGTVVFEKDLEAQVANVLLQADSGVTFEDLNNNGGDGEITMQTNISFRLENQSGSVTINDATDTIRVSGTGSIYMQSGRTGSGNLTNVMNLIATGAGDNPAQNALPSHNVSTPGNGTPGNGTITLYGADGVTVGGALTTNGGYVRIWSDSDNASGGGFTLGSSSPVTTNGGHLHISAGTNDIILNAAMNMGTGRIFFKSDGSHTSGTKILAAQITASGAVNINTPFKMNSGSGISTDGVITFSDTVNMNTGSGTLTLRGAGIDFSAATFSNQSNGSIVIEPNTAASNIDVGAGTGFASATTLSKLSGFKNVTIGRSDATGTTTVPGNVSINVSGNFELINNAINVTGGTLTNTTGNVILTGNVLNITQNVTAGTGGTNSVALQKLSNASAIVVGTDITTAMLSKVHSSVLNIGKSTGGNVSFASDIVTSASTVHIRSAGTVTATSGGVAAANLAVSAGGAVTLNNSTFNFSKFAVSASGQAVNITRNDAGFEFGSVDGVNGVTAGSVNITAAGSLTQSQAMNISGASSFNVGTGNDITLSNAANNFSGAVSVSAARNVTLRDTNALDMGNNTVSGNLSLTAGGAITDSGNLSVSGTTTLSSTGSITLDSTGNNFTTLGAVTRGGALKLVDSEGGLTLAGSVGAHASDVEIVTTGNLTLNNGITIAVSGAGNIYLAAQSGNFLNNAGTSPFTLGTGRWIVYSSTPASNTFGGLVSGQKALWGKSYSGYAPASVTETGNRYVFNESGTINVITTNGTTKTYDGVLADYSSNMTITSSRLSAATYGNVFVGDTLADVFTTQPTVDAVSVNAGTHTITASGGIANAGFTIVYNNTGQVTINPAALTIIGSQALNKNYDGTRTAEVTPGTLSGLIGTETLVVSANGLFSSIFAANNKDVTVTYTLQDGSNGGLASNYTLTGQILKADIIGQVDATFGNKSTSIVSNETPQAVQDFVGQSTERIISSHIQPQVQPSIPAPATITPSSDMNTIELNEIEITADFMGFESDDFQGMIDVDLGPPSTQDGTLLIDDLGGTSAESNQGFMNVNLDEQTSVNTPGAENGNLLVEGLNTTPDNQGFMDVDLNNSNENARDSIVDEEGNDPAAESNVGNLDVDI